MGLTSKFWTSYALPCDSFNSVYIATMVENRRQEQNQKQNCDIYLDITPIMATMENVTNLTFRTD